MEMVGGMKRFKLWAWSVAGEKELGRGEGGKEGSRLENGLVGIMVRRSRSAAGKP